MKDLRATYEQLKNDVLNKYKELVDARDYDFTKRVLDEYEGAEKANVKVLLDNEDFNNLYNYDFQEFLEQIFYNDRRGDEKMCYLLKANKEAGLYVMDNDSSRTFYIGFSDLNELNSKLTVIEAITDYNW